MNTPKAKLSPLAKLILKGYEQSNPRAARYLSETVLEAILARSILSVMMARFEAEADRAANTNPNTYVEAYWEVEKHLGWR